MNHLFEMYHINSKNFPSQSSHCPNNYLKSSIKKNKSSFIATIPKERVENYKTKSSRSFDKNGIRIEVVSNLINTVYSFNTEGGSSIPSAGGFNSLNLYVIFLNVLNEKRGLYYFDAEDGTLNFIKETVDLSFLPRNNFFVLEASIIIIINGIPINLFNKYGERGYRYLLLQAGHLGQNISLYCNKEMLNTCPIGGFYDDILCRTLSLPKFEWPIYLYAVGGKTSE